MITSIFKPLNGSSESFVGSILIIPVVSIGNVPQLASDLLLQSNLRFEHAGALDPRYSVPVALPPTHVSSVEGPSEVFFARGGGGDQAMVLVHSRSPILKARRGTYLASFSQWIRSCNFSSVLILCSVDAATRDDAQLQAPTPLRRFESVDQNGDVPPASSLRGRLCAQMQPLPDAKGQTPLLPAGGIARRLYVALQEAGQPDVGALVVYSSEGDNTTSAHMLAQKAALLCRPGGEFECTVPASWVSPQASLDTELFG